MIIKMMLWLLVSCGPQGPLLSSGGPLLVVSSWRSSAESSLGQPRWTEPRQSPDCRVSLSRGSDLRVPRRSTRERLARSGLILAFLKADADIVQVGIFLAGRRISSLRRDFALSASATHDEF